MSFLESNTSRKDAYRLNDAKFEVLPEDFVRKMKGPKLIAVGKNRANSDTLFILPSFFHEQF